MTRGVSALLLLVCILLLTSLSAALNHHVVKLTRSSPGLRSLRQRNALYCEPAAAAVEVIPPQREGDNLKVILKLPNPKKAKKYLTVTLPAMAEKRARSVIENERVVAKWQQVSTFLVKFKNLMSGNGFTDRADKDFSTKAIAGLGLNALLAYGFVSNVSYITCLVLSWISFSSSTQLSPLAPGQWKPFLAIYAGYWAINNIIRPLRFSLSLVLMPFFNRLIDFVQAKTGYRRRMSTGIVVFAVNFCGTITYMTLGILLASMITGVPVR
jgi:hypothetical protein